jgi:hypothetical protein
MDQGTVIAITAVCKIRSHCNALKRYVYALQKITSCSCALAAVMLVNKRAERSATAAECETPRPGWIWCDDFEQDRSGSYFEIQRSQGGFSRVDGVGMDGSFGMRGTFRAGRQDAGALHVAFGRTPAPYFRPVDSGTADYREVFWRVYVRNDADWSGGGGYKLSRATIFAGSNWSQAMIAHVWAGRGREREQRSEYLVIDPATGVSASGSVATRKYNDFGKLHFLGSVKGRTALFGPGEIGKWHCVEAHVRLNSPGAADGLFELWVNGRLDARRANLDWIGRYSAYGINAVMLENYWNGGAPRTQSRYFDDFVVSTRRIGC